MNQHHMSIYFSSEFVVDGGFDTVSKAGELARLLTANPIARTEIISPAPATRSDIVAVHDEHYVDQVLNGRGGQFSGEDESATSVLATTGGVLRAVETVLENGGCAVCITRSTTAVLVFAPLMVWSLEHVEHSNLVPDEF
jgi:hypothetical protein